MSVTRNSRSIVMTANDDEVTGYIRATSISLVGTGLTVGHRMRVLESSGAVVADHYIEAANENVEFLPTEQGFMGLKLATSATGTWSVIIRYR
jgi:hypothetical protein